MKHVLLILSFISCIASAQEIKVVRTKQLSPGKAGEYILSGTTPDGTQLLVSGANHKGLYLMDIKTGKMTSVSNDPGAGYEPVITPDGRNIFFKSDDFSAGKRVSFISQYEIASGKTTVIEDKARDVSIPVVSKNQLVYKSEGKLQAKNLKEDYLKSNEPDTLVLLEELTPVLYIRGERKALKPNGEGSYIWVSLSPDKTRLLYSYNGTSTYVCDLNGRIISNPGRINAPKWINNQMIIGMEDKDDGYNVTSSEIVSFSLLTGRKSALTSSAGRKEMYPYPFANGKSIAFQTPEGELFIMKIRIK